jgi:hypothetical protein
MSKLQVQIAKDDWIKVINKNSKVYNKNFIQPIPHMANNFDLLANLEEESENSSISYKKSENSNIGSHQKRIRPSK